MCLNCNFTIKIRQNTTSHTQALCFNCSWMVLVTQIHKLQFNWVTYILTLIVHNRGSKISNTPPHMFLLENELFTKNNYTNIYDIYTPSHICEDLTHLKTYFLKILQLLLIIRSLGAVCPKSSNKVTLLSPL